MTDLPRDIDAFCREAVQNMGSCEHLGIWLYRHLSELEWGAIMRRKLSLEFEMSIALIDQVPSKHSTEGR